MKIAYIHNDVKESTGASYINTLIVLKLREKWIHVQSYYPHLHLTDAPIALRGVSNILFFYSLLEKHEKILKCDIIQWTTYTPLAFLHFSKPVISHFGSTTAGFLACVPRTAHMDKASRDIFRRLKLSWAIRETDLKTLRPLQDIALIEAYAASRADCTIATSEIVKQDLIIQGVSSEKIEIIHNAIEDYWFHGTPWVFQEVPTLVFLWRVWEDPFTIKLKGIDRLIALYELFPLVPKYSIMMSRNKWLLSWLALNLENHHIESNIVKTDIPAKLLTLKGGILLIPSRYEGFSLSLIEGMSQGLVPIIFPVWVAPEIIRDGENGYIVTTLAEAEDRMRLLLGDNVLRKRLSLNAEKTAGEFHSEGLVKNMTQLYKKILLKTTVT